ncbi:MAG: hypothetical protein ACR2N2_01325 [Acidimicrobiia bacterium]
MSIRVVVGIRSREVRTALFVALDSLQGMHVVGSATSAAETTTLCRTLKPDVAILEQGLSDWELDDLLDSVVEPIGSGTVLVVSHDNVTDVVNRYENVRLLDGIDEISEAMNGLRS